MSVGSSINAQRIGEYVASLEAALRSADRQLRGLVMATLTDASEGVTLAAALLPDLFDTCPRCCGAPGDMFCDLCKGYGYGFSVEKQG
jgi:hypothetical protein